MYRNIENAKFQLLHDLAQRVVEEEDMAVTQNATQFLPTNNIYNGTRIDGQTNNILYQNYYVPTSGNIHVQQITTDLIQSYGQMPTLAAVQETSNSLSHYANNFNMEQDQQPSNNFELMAQLAADLANVTTPSVNNVNYDTNECVYLKDFKEQQERTLLQNSMSPLLAAVNDITKRDAELQLYLNQSFEKQNELLSSPQLRTTLDKVKENYEEDTTSTIIVDKPVPCRAKGSLPTRYLRLGEINDLTNEPIVIAKKSIIHPTKFGPVEGVIRYVSTIDLDVLHIQVPRFYPLLLVDESHTLDVSNEDSSNWMRYIRLAENKAVQNLQVLLENGRIFYKTTRNIKAQEELRVGYSAVYGARFLLPILSYSMAIEMENKQINNLPSSRLRAKRTKNIKENLMPSTAKMKRKRNAKQKNIHAVAHNSLKKVRCRAEAKIRKEVVQQLRKLLYKCDMCAKRFSDLSQMQKHKLKHVEEPARIHVCHICQQKCATPTALASHIKGHTHSGFICIYCAKKYLHVRKFSQHVATHKTDNGKYTCMHCKRLYATYALVRKHVRLSHIVAHEGQVHGNDGSKASTKFKKEEHIEGIIKKLAYTADVTPERKSEPFKNQVKAHVHADIRELGTKCNNFVNISPNKLDKNVPNIFSASSSNRRKQTPTKLKTLEPNLETLDYVPLSELLTPYLMSEQELHEEFEKAEIETTLTSNTHNKLDLEKQAEQQIKLKLDGSDRISMDTESISGAVEAEAAMFICHFCPNTKFKRRGILVNHITKMHPAIDLDNIESLNTPIIKQQLVYKCCYCKNVYKSAAKRKVHILKHHPGCDIPSYKDKKIPLNVETIGNKEEDIHKCQLCARQYAARSRLVAHYRKAHVNDDPPPKILKNDSPRIYEEPLLISELNMMTAYPPSSTSPENKLLKLSSAALELSRYDFLNERSTDDYQRLPALFDETPLVGIDGLMDRYNHRSIEVQFFEKIGKL